MKQQIERLSPHQNAKVFGVLLAVGSLAFVVPFFIFAAFAAPAEQAPPAWLFLLFPIVYLVLGYLMVVVACAVYNFMFRYVGGIEYTAKSDVP
jgi:cation transporter-like permease